MDTQIFPENSAILYRKIKGFPENLQKDNMNLEKLQDSMFAKEIEAPDAHMAIYDFAMAKCIL